MQPDPRRVAARWASQQPEVLGTTRSGKPIVARAFSFGEWIRAHEGWTKADHQDALDAFFKTRDALVPPYKGGPTRNYHMKPFYEKMGIAHQYGGRLYDSRVGAEMVVPSEDKIGAKSPLATASRAWKEAEASAT